MVAVMTATCCIFHDVIGWSHLIETAAAAARAAMRKTRAQNFCRSWFHNLLETPTVGTYTCDTFARHVHGRSAYGRHECHAKDDLTWFLERLR
jgi:hypothetical protein